MKKLITRCTAFLIAGLFFTSCSSRMSIVKRHYNSGYYVSRSEKTSSDPDSREQGKCEKSAIEKGTVSNPDARQPATKTESDQQLSFMHEKIQQKSNSTVIADGKNPLSAEAQATGIYPSAAPFVLADTHKSPVSINKITKPSTERDGLSLFWLIIVILLILWVFGLLGGGWGLGILINLLLLIALILLILWLLRIV